jgi:hypothetical protein
VGVLAGYQIFPWVYVGSGLAFQQRGYWEEYDWDVSISTGIRPSHIDQNFKNILNYLDVPMHVRLSATKMVHFRMGFNLAFLLNSKIRYEEVLTVNGTNGYSFDTTFAFSDIWQFEPGPFLFTSEFSLIIGKPDRFYLGLNTQFTTRPFRATNPGLGSIDIRMATIGLELGYALLPLRQKKLRPLDEPY